MTFTDFKQMQPTATAQAKRFEASTRESAEAARHALESFDEYEKTLKRFHGGASQSY